MTDLHVGDAAREIASYAGTQLRFSASEIIKLARGVQEMIDRGHLVGRVATGDHDENGKTVLDWSEMP